MEKAPHKKEDLTIANHVLKLATKLLKVSLWGLKHWLHKDSKFIQNGRRIDQKVYCIRHRLFQGRLASGLNAYGFLLRREDF